jgi:hypothetical protein
MTEQPKIYAQGSWEWAQQVASFDIEKRSIEWWYNTPVAIAAREENVESTSEVVEQNVFTREGVDLFANPIEITPQFQQSDFDCGQTVLDMLGYKGHEMFPSDSVDISEIFSLPGCEYLGAQGDEESIDNEYPVVWIFIARWIEGKSEFSENAPLSALHWVIRYRDDVYCPRLGKVSAAYYKEKVVSQIGGIYRLPLVDEQEAQSILDTNNYKIAIAPDERFSPNNVKLWSYQWCEQMAKINSEHPIPMWWMINVVMKHRPTIT